MTLLPRETAFSVCVTDISQSKFPVVNFHGHVKKIGRSAHEISDVVSWKDVLIPEVQEPITMLMML